MHLWQYTRRTHCAWLRTQGTARRSGEGVMRWADEQVKSGALRGTVLDSPGRLLVKAAKGTGACDVQRNLLRPKRAAPPASLWSLRSGCSGRPLRRSVSGYSAAPHSKCAVRHAGGCRVCFVALDRSGLSTDLTWQPYLPRHQILLVLKLQLQILPQLLHLHFAL